MLDKQKITSQVIKKLAKEMDLLELAFQRAKKDFIEAPSAKESWSDTTKSQKENLMVDFAKRLQEKKDVLKQLKKMDFPSGQKITDGSLIEVLEGRKRLLYFIVPGGGGDSLSIAGFDIQLISPLSPIARALCGHQAGDVVEVKLPAGVLKLRVVSVK